MPTSSLPPALEERVRFYEDPANDPGGFTRSDWTLILAAGVLLPVVALLIGWFVGWPA